MKFLVMMLFLGACSQGYQLEEKIQWITDNSDLSYQGEELPAVELTTQEDLQKIVYGNESTQNVVEAVYDPYTTSILLSKRLLREEPPEYVHAVIVHELVHFLQDMENSFLVSANCMAEPEAYRLHEKYMIEFDVPGPLPDRMYALALAMECSGL